jgi:CRISPR-associated endonuclease Csn1
MKSTTLLKSVVAKFCKPRQQQRWEHKTLYDFLKDYVIYFQRALKSQKGNVGMCTLEPKSSRCPKSALIFQEYRIWDKLHSIRIIGPNRNLDPLTVEEKQKAYLKLSVSKEQSIGQLMKLWKLGDEYSCNYDEKAVVKGNVTAHALINVFGTNTWYELTETEKLHRWKIIYDADDNEWLKKYGIEKWELNEDQAKKLTKVGFEKMYAELSQRAMSKILPYMKNQNLDYSQACVQAGYHHSQVSETGIVSNVLSPFNKKINSPIVSQGLFELRKVVNSLITEYALKPDIIRIELARELKMPKEKREAILSRNSKNAKENQDVINDLIQNFQGFNHEADVRTDDITKYKLWKECNGICPYTGDKINASDLFDRNDKYQIEHILPRSRSFDDSFQNKTLCQKSFNIDTKGNLMPYEMLLQGKIKQHQYDEMMERIKDFRRNGKRNVSKIKKFTLQTIPPDMVAQQLNDTQFLSVAAKDYLKQICANVQPTVGAATSQLRKLWGLNRVLNQVGDVKNRNDHRHHAVDAIVVACTSISNLQELSKFNKNKKYNLNLERLAYPYPTFRRDVKDAVEGILISHKVKNRPRGQMHDETMAGKVMNSDKTHKSKVGEPNQKYYTTRIALTDLIGSPAKIMKIGDKVVRDTVLQRLYEKGVNIHEKISKIPNDVFLEPLWMPNKQGKNIHEIKHVRIHDVASNKIEIRKDTFVDGGNNHHIVIFQKPNGKREGRIVSMYEVMAIRKKNGLPAITTDVGEENEFVMTLSTNEMVLVDSNDFKTSEINWNNPNYEELTNYLYRVQMITDGKITFRHHLTSVLKDEEGNEIGRLIKTPNSFEGIKVIINHIGEIKRA